MLSFLVRRLVTLSITVIAASVIVFVVLEVLPGDPALLMLGTEATDETLAAMRAEMGLDRPAIVRYFVWIGDMGISYAYDVPVAKLVADRIAVTIPLALMALALSTAIAIPLGMLAATQHNRLGDYGVMTFSQLGLAIPNFWFGIVLILIFAVHLGWFDSGGFPGWHEGVLVGLKALLLPALALALSEAAILSRVTRSAILETLREDYVRTARAKGLSRRAVMVGHVLRNAMIPVLTIVGLQFAFLVAGAIVVESVFYLPGLGRLLFQAISGRDLIVVKDVVILLAILVVMVNFLVDLLYAVIDPRPKAVG